MKKTYILGNWKSNKTMDEAKEWYSAFTKAMPPNDPDCTVIICPSFHHLPVFVDPPFALGVQDLSPFPEGAYTGEIAAKMVSGDVQYALLGHSERRTNLGETDALISRKVERAIETGITPVVCVSSLEQADALRGLVPAFEKTGLLLYEPLSAIGSGNADTPENAGAKAKEIREILPVPVLYGGSVTPDNVKGFVENEHLSGVGVGGASLDAGKFSRLIAAAR